MHTTRLSSPAKVLPPKPALHAACLAYVHTRLAAARAGMAAAQESSNSETKSSAGNKCETGRAMAQQKHTCRSG